MDNLHSHLKFEFNAIQETLSENIPDVIYRYFSTPRDRDNFLNGNVWFGGPSTNRFFASEPDKTEYRFKTKINQGFINSSHIGKYVLPCSTELLDEGKSNIIIHNIPAFIQAIANAIKDPTSSHQISWHNIKAAQKFGEIEPSILNIKKFPKEKNEKVALHAHTVGGRHEVYIDKKIKPTHYDAVQVANLALNHNNELEGEKEFRIYIGAGDFQGNYNGCLLFHLVQYIKINCPNIAKYCRPIN